MARTIDELLKIIRDAKDAESELDGLNSTSAIADYKLWQEVFAEVSGIIEIFIEEKQAEVTDTVQRRIAPNGGWLDLILRAYQHGDTLELGADGKPYYPVIDPAKQIVKRVAIIEGIGTYRAKVAGEDGAGNVVTLDSAQVSGINNYLDRYLTFLGFQIVRIWIIVT